MNNELSIKDNEFLRQFEYCENGTLAVAEYAIQERKVFLTKLVIPEDLQDADFEARFITAILRNIQEKKLHVVPTSPEIARFLRKHKEFKDLLPVGVRI